MLIEFLERILTRKRRSRSLLISLLIDLAAILLWRGIWGLLDLYIFPSEPMVSFISSALLGIGLLIVIRLMGKI